MTVSLEDEIRTLADFALGLTRLSSPIIDQWFRKDPDISRKSDKTPVTVADHAVEKALRDEIQSQYPDHGIVGEEDGITASDHDFTWVIDPIDGTRAFSTGNPIFGTLIAVLYQNRPVVGVIDIPTQNQTWLGIDGRPTTLNGKTVTTSRQADLSQARLSTTSGHALGEDAPYFQRLSETVMVTCFGGDCANYAHLASGWTDLVAESSLQPHDIMAAVPVINGAGGMITQWNGAPITLDDYNGTALASASAELHDEASRLLTA
jgi:histidinol phosphatase-like enzyme (inositol monophosphatase family)